MMTVAFQELSGSPIETYASDGVTAERRLICAWDDRRQLVQQLLGDGYEFGGASRAKYPGTSNIVAIRARVEAFGDDVVKQSLTELTEGLNAYHGFAKITVSYELLAPSDRSDLPAVPSGTFVTYRMRRDWETVVLPGDDLQWEAEPTVAVPPEAVSSIRLPVIEHRLTWHRVVRPPWSAIRALNGTVNDAAFLGAAPETLLFDGATAEPEFLRISDLDDAEFAWRIEYVFRERTARLLVPGAAAGWNNQYRSQPAATANWDRPHASAHSDHFVYRTSDFGALVEYDSTE